ncbi:MAG: AAA family ATPase [Caldilineaceae bacterium]
MQTSTGAALLELRIRNFAIIDELQINFHSGLNVITGETGAGKSIIIDALGLLLGDRATEEMIRAETDRAEIEGVFRINTTAAEDSAAADLAAAVLPLLEAEGLDDPDDPNTLILSREVPAVGATSPASMAAPSRCNCSAKSPPIWSTSTGRANT